MGLLILIIKRLSHLDDFASQFYVATSSLGDHSSHFDGETSTLGVNTSFLNDGLEIPFPRNHPIIPWSLNLDVPERTKSKISR